MLKLLLFSFRAPGDKGGQRQEGGGGAAAPCQGERVGGGVLEWGRVSQILDF